MKQKDICKHTRIFQIGILQFKEEILLRDNKDITDDNVMENNIELAKRLYTAFLKKDINGILDLLCETVEWGEPENPYNPAGGTRTGHAGFIEWLNIGKNAEDILILEPKKFLCDNDSVAVIGYVKCQAKATGKIYESDFVHHIVIRNSKISKFQEFFDTYAAGEAFKVN